MYELKTRETELDIQAVIEAIAHPGKREDARALTALFSAVTGELPKVWGAKQIGFGRYHYRYPSGHAGTFYKTGFSVGESKISLYLYLPEDAREAALQRLGKAKAGKSCVYINKLADIDAEALGEMIAQTVRFVDEAYPEDNAAPAHR